MGRRILRRADVQAATGLGRSTIYDRIAERLFTRPVGLGGAAVGWPEDEIDALIAARVRGDSDDQIRALVMKLEDARSTAQ